LDFKRLVGNGPVADLITYQGPQWMAGDQPDEEADAVLGGDGDTTVTTDSLGGDATSITTSDLLAPQWNDYGQFKWWAQWVTDGKKGWIVQQINNTYSGFLSDGTAITNATVPATPSYYEAWEVSAGGGITGSLGGTGNRDRWERRRMPPGSNGSWSMTGTAFWTAKDPAASGFTSPSGIPDAGDLLASKSAPPGLSGALLTRNAYGAWDSSGAILWPGSFTS
jgi:hypothetical protein